MKIISIQATPRPVTGGKNPRKLIPQGLVPGVIYGTKKRKNIAIPLQVSSLDVHITSPCFIDLTLEGTCHRCILQKKEHHPVSDTIIHVEFFRIEEAEHITMEIPLHLAGQATGVEHGGVLVKKIRKLRVRALPAHMPEEIVLDITSLELGKTIKINAIEVAKYTILHSPLLPVAMVEIPRSLRGKTKQESAKA